MIYDWPNMRRLYNISNNLITFSARTKSIFLLTSKMMSSKTNALIIFSKFLVSLLDITLICYYHHNDNKKQCLTYNVFTRKEILVKWMEKRKEPTKEMLVSIVACCLSITLSRTLWLSFIHSYIVLIKYVSPCFRRHI